METVYQQFIHKSRYAKFLEIKGRREHWEETVNRVTDYLFLNLPEHFVKEYKEEVREAILKQNVMSSMRLMMTAGDAHQIENVNGYNCCYVVVDDKDVFSEIFYILLNGTGVGFSVENQYVSKLPSIKKFSDVEMNEYDIPDSKIGWAEAYKYLIDSLFQGIEPKFNYSLIRPAGTRLKTMGGYASGPEPLKRLFEHTIKLFRDNQEKQLTRLQTHSLVCYIASVVVVGGVRRSALISLSDLDDKEIANCKTGEWWVNNQHFSLANNSAVYNSKPSVNDYLKESSIIYSSYSGERGFFNREGCKNKALKEGRKDEEYGCNPCSEIILRPFQFCNLTEVIVKANDTEETLKEKIKIATIIGTIQSSYVKFNFLRDIYKKNTEEEALLGVSMTGIYDNPIVYKSRDGFLRELKEYAILVNKEVAKIIGVNQSASITCIKPSGTVSALCNTASGLHPRYAKYYIRRVRCNKTDPITNFLRFHNIPNEVDFYSKDNIVFSFPTKAPDNCITTKDLTALEHYEAFLKFNDEFCSHKPSITISYKPDEFIELTSAIWKTWDRMTGISVLPLSDHTYQQAPYEEINEEQYEEMVKLIPSVIDWNLLREKEVSINMDALQCVGSNCDTL